MCIGGTVTLTIELSATAASPEGGRRHGGCDCCAGCEARDGAYRLTEEADDEADAPALPTLLPRALP